MIELIRSLVDVVVQVVTLFVHTLESIVIFVQNIPNYLSFFVDSFNVLPAVIIPFAIASIYVYVMYFIIARN